MNGQLQNRAGTSPGRGGEFDLDALLHPARAYAHPNDVVRDADLTLYEKRAILASWASDACAVEAAHDVRVTPDTGRAVRFDDVMDALRALDGQAEAAGAPRKWQRLGGIRERLSRRRSRSGGDGGSHAAAV